MEKSELVILALQQRIGEIVSNYESQIAVLRAEITAYTIEQQEKQKALDEYSSSLQQKIEE